VRRLKSKPVHRTRNDLLRSIEVEVIGNVILH